MRRLALLAALLPLAGCGGAGGGCSTSIAVHNASSTAIEQLYVGGGDGSWGNDLLAGGVVPPGGSQAVQARVPAASQLRLVWADGRAAVLAADYCSTSRVTVSDGVIRAE